MSLIVHASATIYALPDRTAKGKCARTAPVGKQLFAPAHRPSEVTLVLRRLIEQTTISDDAPESVDAPLATLDQRFAAA